MYHFFPPNHRHDAVMPCWWRPQDLPCVLLFFGHVGVFWYLAVQGLQQGLRSLQGVPDVSKCMLGLLSCQILGRRKIMWVWMNSYESIFFGIKHPWIPTILMWKPRDSMAFDDFICPETSAVLSAGWAQAAVGNDECDDSSWCDGHIRTWKCLGPIIIASMMAMICYIGGDSTVIWLFNHVWWAWR